jgi:DNA-binding winged helix-turn-helix (wHTH) protein/tetratricopeptide (TPR) repeat protein
MRQTPGLLHTPLPPPTTTAVAGGGGTPAAVDWGGRRGHDRWPQDLASPVPVANVYRFSAFELDCRTRELRRNGKSVAMPARCFECLQHLISQRARAVSRDELAQAVFGRNNVSDAQLGQVVLRARRVVGDDGQHQRLIRTVPRYGFQWVGETRESDSPPETVQMLSFAPAASSTLQPQRWQRQGLAAALLLVATTAWGLLGGPVPMPLRDDPEQVLLQTQQDFLAGRHQRGLVTLDHLLEAQGSRGDARLRARALLQRARFEIRLGRHLDAEQDFSAAIGLLDMRVEPALLGRAHNGRGVARTALGRFDAAQEDLQRARALLGRSGDLRSLRWVNTNLGVLQQRSTGAVGGPGHDPSTELNTFVGRDAGDPGALGPAAGVDEGQIDEGQAAVHVELASLHRQLLEWPQARRHAASAWALREQVPNAAGRTALAMGLAETLVGSGRLHEARALLAARGDGQASAGDGGRAGLLRTELAWRSGDPGAALALADRTLADWQPDADPVLRRRLQRQRLQLGLAAGAPVPDAIVAMAAADDTMDAWLIRALAAQAHGMEPEAGLAYRQALARAEDEGTPARIVAVATSYLPWLLERGEIAQASALADRISPWAGHDYDAAVLQMRLLRAVGDHQGWRDAAANARRLAGERALPAMLEAPPASARDGLLAGR